MSITVCSNVIPQVKETSEKIDVEKLKSPEKIHFYDEIILYEDELHDHGCAVLNVKVVIKTINSL